ncbi:hypothetical protein GIB67_005589 [Kingdonia uniflora]|uniref:Myb/SANT-like domain-containing protein n=1 Tax=Kingdonia uniflora TaxID=39325 RepID=A0A7J7MMQ9_9MAGN|nr:hypothetical protein GIB67_005589 [Kingdonia uniflora]
MAYNKTSFNLKRETNLDVIAEQCKTRWKTLKANHLLVKKVVESSGFGWNEETQLVTAKEVVWKEFIEMQKLAQEMMKQTFYKKVIILFYFWKYLVHTTALYKFVISGFKVDNDGVESVYSTIDERTSNRASSSTTPVAASVPSTGASVPKMNKVCRDSLDRDDGAIEKLALTADKVA